METQPVVLRSGLIATRLQPADPLKQAGIHLRSLDGPRRRDDGANGGWIALRLRHEAQDLPHDLHHLLQLVGLKASKGMGPGAAGFPVERLDLMTEHIARAC